MKEISVDKYRRYYKELFDVHSEELFKRLWGSDVDENGDKYTSVFLWELKEISENFCDFMITFDIYEMDKDVSSLSNYLIFQMDGLADINNPFGVDFISRSILAAIKERATINGVRHPLYGSDEIEPVIIDGDIPKSYVLIQDDGYYEDEMSSQVVASSKDKKKLELLCDDRVNRLKSTAKYVGYQEVFEVYNSYRQLVDEIRKLRVNWRIEEVLEV